MIFTFMVVVGNGQPFGRFFFTHADHRRAETCDATVDAEIVLEEEVRRQLATPLAS